MIVEKDAVFQRLAQEGFAEATSTVLVTGKGMPDYGTRCFISHLISQFPSLLVVGGQSHIAKHLKPFIAWKAKYTDRYPRNSSKGCARQRFTRSSRLSCLPTIFLVWSLALYKGSCSRTFLCYANGIFNDLSWWAQSLRTLLLCSWTGKLEILSAVSQWQSLAASGCHLKDSS